MHYICIVNTNKIKKQAELKLFKFGELLTDKADDNPEPSLKDPQEGVETRRRVCIKCGDDIPATKYSSSKYCSVKCRNAYLTYLYKIRKGLIKKPGTGSGGNQWGENNHQYKNGIGLYKKLPFTTKEKICERCGSNLNILVHHKDENRSNNTLDNLEVLCKKCHQNHHCTRDAKTGKYIKG